MNGNDEYKGVFLELKRGFVWIQDGVATVKSRPGLGSQRVKGLIDQDLHVFG